MTKTAAIFLALATIAATGCASMGTKRPSGGAQITKTTTEDKVVVDAPVVETRADLGQ